MSLHDDVIGALENDHELDFKSINPGNTYIQDGLCPQCGKRKLWTYRDSPWVLLCGALNQCGTQISVRDRYKDLFENFTERYPATIEDPNASARAYLEYNRGFNPGLIAGWYSQEQMILADGSRAQSIRFPISDECYWARLINTDDIKRNDDHKAKIVGSYKGECWQPPGQEINDGDWVWITEAIFKSIALLSVKYKDKPLKTISGLSANNLPIEFIKRHAGKKIVWVIALDNDPAGRSVAPDYKQEIKALGESVMVAFPNGKEDWDDEYRKRKKQKDSSQYKEYLNDSYFTDSLWRGCYHTSKEAKEKAFWLFVKKGYTHMVIDFNQRLWRSALRDKKDVKALQEFNEQYSTNKERLYTDPSHDKTRAKEQFVSAFSTVSISNCLPQFLYAEINPQTSDKHYFFRVTFPNRRNYKAMACLSASDIDCPSAFKKSLLNKVTGARFKGFQADLDTLQESWFDQGTGPDEIRTIPFIGYDKHTQAYAFPEFGYCQGKMVTKNKDGYLAFGHQSIKSNLQLTEDHVYHKGNTVFNASWYADFYHVFQNEGLACLSFWTGSLFADQIRKSQEGYLMLELSGERETGKTTLTKFLWRLLGVDRYEGVDPQKFNEKALARKFAQVSNIPVVMTEGDRNETKGRSMFGYDWLKTAWEGGIIRGVGLKNHGLEINEDPFKGTVMIVQNLTVDGSDALLSRIVHLHMTAKGYNPDAERRILKLREMDIEELASFRNRMLSSEKELLSTYFGEYEKAHTKLIERANDNEEKFTPRVLQNHAQVLAWAKTLQTVFGKDLITNQQLDEFTDFMWERGKDRQRRLQTEHPLLQQFWDYYDVLNWKTVWEQGQQYTVENLNHLTGTGKIAINLTDFDEACGDHKLQRLDMSELKKMFPNSTTRRFIENKPIRSKLSHKKGQTRSCWIFQEAING